MDTRDASTPASIGGSTVPSSTVVGPFAEQPLDLGLHEGDRVGVAHGGAPAQGGLELRLAEHLSRPISFCGQLLSVRGLEREGLRPHPPRPRRRGRPPPRGGRRGR